MTLRIASRMRSTGCDFGMKPDAPQSRQLRMVAGIVAGRHDHHRHLRVLRAQVDQPGHAVHARHGQVEQDEVDVGPSPAASVSSSSEPASMISAASNDALQRLAQARRETAGGHRRSTRRVLETAFIYPVRKRR